MNNDNQDDCEVAAKPVVQQEPVFTSKDVPNGRDFHCDVPQGENVWMVSDLMKSGFWTSSQARHASREQCDVGMSAMAMTKIHSGHNLCTLRPTT